MNEYANNIKELSRLVDENRPHEALVRFLVQISDKSFSKLSTSEMVMLDFVCQRALPELLEHKTLWMVNHPYDIRRMLELLINALAVDYRPAATVDNIAWLRCLLAIEEAKAGRVERVHEELCLVSGDSEGAHIPKPNGTLRRKIQSIGLTEKSASRFLELFFDAYMEFLKRVGQYEMANHLENRVGKLLGLIARDERRPGVVQALFYDKLRAVGITGFVHVTTERLSAGDDKASSENVIEYARKEEDIIDVAMQEATVYTRCAVDAYLKRAGYPDGLDERIVRWEIGTVQGDTVRLERQFQGGSIALPLAIAIVSQYLAKPVPNDIAFTGAFTATGASSGQMAPVDGIPEKVEQAIASGCKLIYLPAANLPDVKAKPTLRNLISEHDARIVAADNVGQVCKEVFPAEGSGRLKDLVRDTVSNLRQILQPAAYSQKFPSLRQAHHRHRIHIILCSILTAALVFLEGLRLYKAFAPTYPSVAAWARIITSTMIIIIGAGVSFALPSSCLRHGKIWSWYTTIAFLAISFSVAAILIGGMLPDFTHISSIYNAPPAAGLVKDMFIIWVFAWGLAANTFNAVAALEDLVTKRQFVTARNCLRWNSPLETRMPIRCIHFPWMWGGLVIGVTAAFLMASELRYYVTVDTSTNAGYWETFLGLARDLLLLIVIAEVMIFYKMAVARIRRSLN